jgi:hypothetical protein
LLIAKSQCFVPKILHLDKQYHKPIERRLILKLWTGPPTEGEDSSLSISNHSAAGPQARTGLQQFASVYKTAKNKEDTRRTFTNFFFTKLKYGLQNFKK